MDHVLEYVGNYKYLAMFGILFLCGVGLPLPEEVTLIASGLFVGWKQADFFYASVACVSAIIAGDSVIFFLGRHFGYHFLRFILSPERLEKAKSSFHRHSYKTVFFARFFAGIRIGVYAYAGAHRMSWFRFAFLDFLGAMISGPTSIWIGKFAAEQVGSPEQAALRAQELLRNFHYWIFAGIAVIVLAVIGVWLVRRRRRRQSRESKEGKEEKGEKLAGKRVPPATTTPAGTLGREDPPGG